jgi:hypothetical protein
LFSTKIITNLVENKTLSLLNHCKIHLVYNMVRFAAVASVAVFLGFVSAAPAPDATTTAADASPTLNYPHDPDAQFNVTSSLYYLKTRLLDGDDSKDGLYRMSS